MSADTELISAPAYFRAAQDAPSLNAFGTAISIVQDELAHAHIAYRLLEDVGVDKDWLIYERPAAQWKYPYAFDVPLDSWYELVMANAFYDQAGYELLSDVYHSTTFGPWKQTIPSLTSAFRSAVTSEKPISTFGVLTSPARSSRGRIRGLP